MSEKAIVDQIAPKASRCFTCKQPVYWIALESDAGGDVMIPIEPRSVPWGDIMLIDAEHGVMLPDETTEPLAGEMFYVPHSDYCRTLDDLPTIRVDSTQV